MQEKNPIWKFDIDFSSFQQVQKFVELAECRNFEITVGNYRQQISGKFLMGMFSLDYSQPMQVSAFCSESEFLRFRQDVQTALS